MGTPKDGSFHEGLHSLLLGQGWLNAWELSNFHFEMEENSHDLSMPFEVPVPKLGEEVHGAENQSRGDKAKRIRDAMTSM